MNETVNHRHRAQLALNRIIAVLGEEAAVKMWIKSITYKRMDKIADQGEELASAIEAEADYMDLIDTQRSAVA